ncbi:hypothetical protein ACIQM4_17465 [Streptomyces sp. NPDC091272]|uniref:hypothetical protein n=1 Tax=Streptomyces sp. NPDC091272 TaxID=3365981 RepID=UPI0037F4487E
MSRSITLVTGGSRRIAAATCLRLAVDGHDIALDLRTQAVYAATYTAAEGAAISETQAKAMAGATARQSKDSFGQGMQQ